MTKISRRFAQKRVVIFAENGSSEEFPREITGSEA
jgi:hypothetical protein